MAQPLSLFHHIVMASSSQSRKRQLLGGDGLETSWSMAAWEGRRAEVRGLQAAGWEGREWQQLQVGIQGSAVAAAAAFSSLPPLPLTAGLSVCFPSPALCPGPGGGGSAALAIRV